MDYDILDLACGTGRYAPGTVVQQIAPDYATYADRLSGGADSVLASLAPDEFAAGLASILAKRADTGPVVPIVEPIDFLIFGTAVERT